MRIPGKEFLKVKSKALSITYLVIPLIVLLVVLPYSSIQTFASPEEEWTICGVPRGDVLIVQTEAGRVVDPTDMNFWKPANPTAGASGVTLAIDELWKVNCTVPGGRVEGWLAEGPPEYSDDYSIMRVKLRKGIYWSDGVEFTADDVVFTIKLHLEDTRLSWSGLVRKFIEDAYAEDKYTVVIKLKTPSPKVHLFFSGILAWGTLHIMPKHIFEKVEDPLKFKFFPPVGTGAYVLKDYDPNGYWWLWERREDWERSVIGVVFGKKPAPKYVLRIYYPTYEKRAMALARHELDFGELPLEMVDQIRTGVFPYAKTWYDGFPYVWFPTGDAGPCFNCMKYPYNITDVRWALTLAVNIVEAYTVALHGMVHLAPIYGAAATPFLEPIYAPKLLPWLKNFTLPGDPTYKPFDPTIPEKFAEWAKAQGYTLAGTPQELFGIGWWKYDPKEAEKLLKKHGFYRDEAGKWRLPNGELWTIRVMYPSGWHIVWTRIGMAVIDQWKKFGIEVVGESVDSPIYWSRASTGDFDVYIMVPFGGVIRDLWRIWYNWHKMFVKPIGEVAAANHIRWANDRFSELLDELAKIPPDDPRVIDYGVELCKEIIKDMPHMAWSFDGKLIFYDTYVWEGWPTAKNPNGFPNYWAPHSWEYYTIWRLKNTGRAPSTEYGKPPKPPTPAIPKEVTAAIKTIGETVATIQTDVATIKEKVSDLSGKVDALSGQMGMLTAAAAIEGIVIIILAAVLVMAIRRRS
ncbi:MAG: ABC transporter substrate-binding protein [Thermoprotei archaeon]|nr:MAG: ABC transporter substrate-binding protein [Thermoprotei archaeon]